MKISADAKLIGAAVIVAGVALWWLTRKGTAANVGASVGKAAVDLVAGTVGGVAGGVADVANNPDINPFQPFGAWLGGKVYDITH